MWILSVPKMPHCSSKANTVVMSFLFDVVSRLLESRKHQTAVCDLLAVVYTSALFPSQNITNSAMSSCSHMVHHSCLIKLIENTSSNLETGYFFCPVCRRIENTGLFILTSSLINREWRRRTLGETLFNPTSINDSLWSKVCSIESMKQDDRELVRVFLFVHCRIIGGLLILLSAY